MKSELASAIKFQILAVAPLRLHIDVETEDTANSTIRIRGDASFKYVRERVTCD
jgi:hypothetical protein